MIGTGVAGNALEQPNLGAIVRAFDVRPEVAEQIDQGAEFLMLKFDEDGAGKRLCQAGLTRIH